MTDETPNTPQDQTPRFDPNQPDSLISFLEQAEGPVPLDKLADAVGAADQQRGALKETLESLAARGRIIETREGRFGHPAKMNLVVGRLQCHEKGFGFVVPRDPGQDDLYIPRRKLGDALHGDLVVARKEATDKHRTEGRIIRLLERARTRVVGKFERGPRFGYVSPLDPRIGYEVYIGDNDAGDAQTGQLVTAEITRYPEGKGRRNPEGKIVEVLGDPDDPRLDVEVIIREFNLPHEFPEEVLAEAEKIATEVDDEDIEGREDFRELPIVTIDGENAKDFDDAVHVEKLDNGNYQLQVHIADVSAYVPVGSAIDREAQLRATSVYFPDRVVPMLPERLSNEICSLKPQVDRLVQSVVIEIDKQGQTVDFRFHDGVIRSAERMTYKQVATLLDGSDTELEARYADHVEHFKLMSELCDVLRKYRMQRGSIDFDLPEPEMRINMVGEVEDIFRSERNQAHRLIEEFMIRANEVVASHTVWEDVPSVYRVHEGPDPEKVEQFREFIGGIGLHLGGGKSPDPGDFQTLVEHLEGQPGERTLIYLMLRTMKQARYQPDNFGHFGLASPRYTHFTSPIRRYPDLIVHRMLKVDRGADTQEDFDVEALAGSLFHLCTQSSERERNAEGAERRYVDWKTVQFMADKQGDSFEAFITGVHAYGFFVELEALFVEGLVHVSSLDDDYYQYDERKHTLRGEKKGRTFTLGNRVRVQLARVDQERRRLDFALEEGPLETGIKPLEKSDEEEKAESSGRRRRRRRGRRKDKGKDKGEPQPAQQAKQEEAKAAKPADDKRAADADKGDDKQDKDRQEAGGRRRRGRRGRGGGGAVAAARRPTRASGKASARPRVATKASVRPRVATKASVRPRVATKASVRPRGATKASVRRRGGTKANARPRAATTASRAGAAAGGSPTRTSPGVAAAGARGRPRAMRPTAATDGARPRSRRRRSTSRRRPSSPSGPR